MFIGCYKKCNLDDYIPWQHILYFKKPEFYSIGRSQNGHKCVEGIPEPFFSDLSAVIVRFYVAYKVILELISFEGQYNCDY